MFFRNDIFVFKPKIEKIAYDMEESRTYVLESLLDYAVLAYEKEAKK